METSDNARVASWYLSKIADSKDNSEINSNPLGFREALVDILCSHTDLRVDNSQMTDEIAELREACIGIYDDFAYEEIISMSPSIFEVWNLGMKFKNK